MAKKDNIQYILDNISIAEMNTFYSCVQIKYCRACCYCDKCPMIHIANELENKKIDISAVGTIEYKGRVYELSNIRKLKLFDIILKKKHGKSTYK